MQAIIFDCDGTLVDSETLGVAALAEEAAVSGAHVDPAVVLEELRGLKISERVELIEARSGGRRRRAQARMRTLPQ